MSEQLAYQLMRANTTIVDLRTALAAEEVAALFDRIAEEAERDA